MSTSHSASPSDSTTSDTTDDPAPTPALGSRDNWWGDHENANPERRTGHTECRGTDPADYVAHQLALQLVEPVCGRTGAPLSDPILYLPKQIEIAEGQYIEYRQHRHRRRVNEETGYINWGETTSTAVPEFEYDVFQRAVHTYLASRGCRLTAIEDYLEYAEQVWADPSMGSKDSLAQFVRYVRDEEASTE